MAVVLGVAAAVLLALSAVLGPDQPSPWLRAVYVFAQWTGPLLLIALAGLVLWRRLLPWATKRLVELAGPALIRAMSPRAVLEALLPWVYGDTVAHEDVVTSVLGGAGRDPEGQDTAVSRHTTAHFRLQAIDDSTCISEATWTHAFSGVRRNHKFVVFATASPDIAALLANERVYPLFEMWIVKDEDELEDFVPNLRRGLQIGITYAEQSGQVHEVPPRRLEGEEVALRGYDELVRLPEGVDRKDIRIVQFDLWDLADQDHVVESIERVAIRATTVNSIDTGFITWTPPHPCFVRDVCFDVSELAPVGQTLVYLVVGSAMRKKAGLHLSHTWTEVRDQIEIDLDAWMLPGHAVTLLWRPLDGRELHGAAQRW
jgi:hypothetical protein